MATLGELKKRKMELRNTMDRERRDFGAISEETGLEYSRLIDRLQEGERKTLVKTLLVLLLTIVSVGGCGKCMRGVGLIGEGFGDALVAGGQHLQESSSEE